jgi:hypothetical protein
MADVKVTLGDVLVVSNILGRIITTPMDFKLSYRLNRIAKKINSEAQSVDEYRKKLFQKYGYEEEVEKDGVKVKTGKMLIPADKNDEYIKEITDFLQTEVEIEMQLIPYADLEKSSVRVSPGEMPSFEKFITVPPGETLKAIVEEVKPVDAAPAETETK